MDQQLVVKLCCIHDNIYNPFDYNYYLCDILDLTTSNYFIGVEIFSVIISRI